MNILFRRLILMLVLLVGLWPSVVTAGAPTGDGKKSILVIRPEGEQFEQVKNGLAKGVEDELTVYDRPSSADIDPPQIKRWIDEAAPSLVVLMDNKMINVYRQYQKLPGQTTFPPSVSIAALQIDQAIVDIQNATGILYEIPAVTSLIHLRAIMKTPVKKVGVVHREWMRASIQQNIAFAKREGIELIPYELPDESRKPSKKIKQGLEALVKQGIDAVWVVNDNTLISGATLVEGWQPALKRTHIPVVVGAVSLIKTQFNFGSFAVFPDHDALGAQAASLILDIMDADWQVESGEVEQPLSVKVFLNKTVTEKKGVKIREDRLGQLDEIID